MHEMSIAQSIADIVLSTASRHDAARVLGVKIQAGRMRGIVPEQLSFCFTFMVRGTIAEGAELVVEEVPIRTRCRRCQRVFEVEDLRFLCPGCGSGDLETLSGMELMVRDIEISDERSASDMVEFA